MFQHAVLTLKVSDLQRAVTFYAVTLGLPRGPQYGEHWAEIHAPGIKIGLHPGGTPHVDIERNMSIGLRVDDLASAMSQLQQNGVTFTATRSDDGSKQAYFNDPDGNPLYLIQLAAY